METLLFLFLILAYSGSAFAQKTVTGYVYNAQDKQALPGTLVTQGQTNNHVISDDKGFFSISIPADTVTLHFGFIGFTPKQHPATNDTLIIFLEADTLLLREFTPFVEVFYQNSLSIGYSSGIRFTPFGVALQGYATYLAGVPFSQESTSPIKRDF